jgi:hypothetical protein
VAAIALDEHHGVVEIDLGDCLGNTREPRAAALRRQSRENAFRAGQVMLREVTRKLRKRAPPGS